MKFLSSFFFIFEFRYMHKILKDRCSIGSKISNFHENIYKSQNTKTTIILDFSCIKTINFSFMSFYHFILLIDEEGVFHIKTKVNVL